jgi:hypothetical protein
MKEYNEKMKKEYSTPQMEVLDGAVQSFLCASGGDNVGDVIVDDD